MGGPRTTLRRVSTPRPSTERLITTVRIEVVMRVAIIAMSVLGALVISWDCAESVA